MHRKPPYNPPRCLSQAVSASLAACFILGLACKSPLLPSRIQSEPSVRRYATNPLAIQREAPKLRSYSTTDQVLQSADATSLATASPVPTSPVPTSPVPGNPVPAFDNTAIASPAVSSASTFSESASAASIPPSNLAHASQSSTPNIRLVISGVRPARGSVKVAIYTAENEFPNPQNASRRFELAATEATIETSLPFSGRFAVGVYQDINADGDLNRNRFGIPTEPFAFSNNAKGTRGPPSFDQAAVDQSVVVSAGDGAPLTVSIHLP